MRKHQITVGWVEGISDGLTRPCAICKSEHLAFDFIVDDDFWTSVVPEAIRQDVVCLSCFDCIATEKGLDLSNHLQQIQFTGQNKTIVLHPSEVYIYS